MWNKGATTVRPKYFKFNSFSVRQNQTSHHCCLIKRPNSPDKRPWRHETPDVTSRLSSPDDPSWPFANALRDQTRLLISHPSNSPSLSLNVKKCLLCEGDKIKTSRAKKQCCESSPSYIRLWLSTL